MSILPDTQLCIAGDLPFGGYKSSGIGRAWGIEGIEEYFEKKALAWRVPGPQ
jgi:aldehyde dehydrogenase (NAD+)